jgi:hypothetical protein
MQTRSQYGKSGRFDRVIFPSQTRIHGNTGINVFGK